MRLTGKNRQTRWWPRLARWTKTTEHRAEDAGEVVWDIETSEVVQEAPRKNLVVFPVT
jgi:hypothetical protein